LNSGDKTSSANWLRQEENQYLSCPPAIAATLPYSMGGRFLGFYSEPAARGGGIEFDSPEGLFDRGPQDSTEP